MKASLVISARGVVFRLVVLAGLAALLVVSGARTHAAGMTFNVNSPADVGDANPGDGVCRTSPTNSVCTLRAAIDESNANPGTDTIQLQGTTYTLSNGELEIADSVSILGVGQSSTIIDGNGAATMDRVFRVDGNGPGGNIVVSMSNLTLSGGKLSGGDPNHLWGGGVFNAGHLTLDHVTITGNQTTSDGGGIYSYGVLNITNSTISGNATSVSSAYGGGIYAAGDMVITNSTIAGNTVFGDGGGVYIHGHVTIKDSTISGNTAVDGGGISRSPSQQSTVWVINSTISGNFATSGGGGIDNAAGTLDLYNDTIADNTANSDHTSGGIGGGVLNASGATVNFIETIIASNGQERNAKVVFIDKDDCSGTITSQGYNIVRTPNPPTNPSQCTINGAFAQVDPQLGALQDNGGPTQTQALSAGSPAIDAGNAAGCFDDLGAILTTDQRGDPRPTDGDGSGGAICDIGAYEAPGTSATHSATPTTSPTPTSSGTGTPSPTPTHTPTPSGTSTASGTTAPTATSSAGSSATPTPTPAGSQTPAPTGSTTPGLIEGDVDCSGNVDAMDALDEVTSLAGFTPEQQQPCPGLNTLSPKFGDVDCDGSVDVPDVTKLLKYSAHLPLSNDPPCSQVGDARAG